MVQVKNDELQRLFDTVVSGGYCIGCGVCACITASPIEMKMTKSRQITATLPSEFKAGEMKISPLSVCPFSGTSMDEDAISEQLFTKHASYHERIGFHGATYAGYVLENSFRQKGSSGGMVSWILAELIKRKLIDGVIHVKKCDHDKAGKRHFKYAISTTVDEIKAGSKSRYYPIELSEVLNQVRLKPGKYALVGVPCFIRAVRLLAQHDDLIKNSIAFYVGLVCGHLKSERFADLFAWQVGIKPGDINEIDFRHKLPFRKASRYGIKVTGLRDGKRETIISPTDSVYGSPWEYGFFKYSACDYCDDVLAETADIALGDAWIRKYNQDYEGTNVVVTRNPIFLDIIKEGIVSNRLHLETITPDEVAQSQGGGLRHRREGLGYRLHLKDKEGVWWPKKRILPQDDHISSKRKKIFECRMAMAEKSHVAFLEALDAKEFSVFKRQMMPLTKEYRNIYEQDRNKILLQCRKIVTFINDEIYLPFVRKWLMLCKKAFR